MAAARVTESAASRPAAPRVVATDLDGTLLRSDGTLSVRTRRALQAAEDADIKVVFVTARPPRWLAKLVEAVSGHGHIICLGGACLLEVSSGRVLTSTGFADPDLSALTSDLRDALPGIGFGAERVDGAAYEAAFAYEDAWAAHDLTPVTLADQIEQTLGGPWPVAKLLARTSRPVTGSDPNGFLATAQAVAGDRAHLAYSGVPGLAEFLPRGVTKASALAQWCAQHDVTAAEVWAFGDMPNDLPMLTWAGRSFAMGNAHPDVLAAASTRTATNDEDGVARALETVLG